jgi:hypothetical protein
MRLPQIRREHLVAQVRPTAQAELIFLVGAQGDYQGKFPAGAALTQSRGSQVPQIGQRMRANVPPRL